MSQLAAVRVRLGKGDEMRFVSHLGFMRAFERTLRRARIPVAYSGGYHPHPRISFATALGVGMTSEAEYLDTELDASTPGGMTTRDLFEQLKEAAPPGMPIIAACAVRGNPALASRIEWASYRISGVADLRPELASAALELLSSDRAIAQVNTKSGQRPVDIRPMVRDIGWSGRGELECTLACGGRAHLRPQDFVAYLGSIEERHGAHLGDPKIPGQFCIHRTGLYFSDGEGGDLISPMSVECADLVTDLVMAMGWEPGELTRGS